MWTLLVYFGMCQVAESLLLFKQASLASICDILPRGENDDATGSLRIAAYQMHLRDAITIALFFASKTMFIAGLTTNGREEDLRFHDM